MKPLTYFIIGLVLGALAVTMATPRNGRYVIVNLGIVDSPVPVRLDTATGRTWHYQGGWIVMPEPK